MNASSFVRVRGPRTNRRASPATILMRSRSRLALAAWLTSALFFAGAAEAEPFVLSCQGTTVVHGLPKGDGAEETTTTSAFDGEFRGA